MTTKPRLLKGFRDYLPETMIAKARMLRRVETTFERFGFAPLQTPALEYEEVLLGKYGAEGDKLLYRFNDLGDRRIAMRYDLTVPLARVVAQYGDLEQPFRRYQIGTVWRAEKPGPGRYREFMQCDVDIAGTDSILADAEILAAGAQVLLDLGVDDFVIRVNNRKILNGALARAGIADDAAAKDALRVVDKLPKIGEEKVRDELASAAGLEPAAIDALFDFLRLSEAPSDEARLARLDEMFPPPADDADATEGAPEAATEGATGVRELRELLEYVAAMGHGDRVEIDLSIARGLDYYTGTIYETFLRGREGSGSIMSGGRYDTLIGVFRKQPVPAVGISLGIDRLFNTLLDLGLVSVGRATAVVMVAVFDPGSAGTASAIASEMRAAGIPTELYPAADKLKRQFKYADKKGIEFVVLAGPDELRAGTVKVKRLETGEERAVERGEIARYFETVGSSDR